MKQLVQKLKNGEMKVAEVPIPVLGQGMILVKNHYSLISAGTESGTVTAARKSLIGKAKERPQQAKQVMDVLKSQGPVQTYRAVTKKLDAWSGLGYSCVGEVIALGERRTEEGEHKTEDIRQRAEVGGWCSGFRIGDVVACAGLTANHGEVVAVPRNLCVKVPHGVNGMAYSEEHLRMAAYNTLGAISLQAVRQADVKLGECCAVIGLGLLGQLACLMLRASGVRVFGVDVNPWSVQVAGEHCCDYAWSRQTPGLEEQVFGLSSGLGVDAVIIAAASSSLDPINFAGAIARKRGRIVILGAVPMGFDRDPHFYRKELEIRMSCSYGPGRYDPNYEERGIDYPPAYVRWTEKRNMEAFQSLIAEGQIDVGYLTSHVFKLEDAPKAYDLLLEKKNPYLGILIQYDSQVTQISQIKQKVRLEKATSESRFLSFVRVAFIGAGSYAQSHLLPNIPKGEGVALKGVMTSTPSSSRSVAERFGFEFCTGDDRDILGDDTINTVFIATRHNSHGDYVARALEAGKHVFVEKPLCLNLDELTEIQAAYDSWLLAAPQTYANEKILSQQLLMVGYNRRFSPLTKMLKEKLGVGPCAMLYRVNAGAVPADSWIHDPEIGGGRILGEVCHFVDYMTFINGSLPVEVQAFSADDPKNFRDTLTVSLRFQNGSIGTIAYFANGAKEPAKEYVEIHANGVTALLQDFRELTIYGGEKKFRKKLFSQDKGQKETVRSFIHAIRNRKPSPIEFQEIEAVTRTTFGILDSLQSGNSVRITC